MKLTSKPPRHRSSPPGTVVGMDETLGSRASRPEMGVAVNGTSTRSSTAEELPRRSAGDPSGDEGDARAAKAARDNTNSANARSAQRDIARDTRDAPIPVARGRQASPGMLQSEEKLANRADTRAGAGKNFATHLAVIFRAPRTDDVSCVAGPTPAKLAGGDTARHGPRATSSSNAREVRDAFHRVYNRL